MKKSSSRKNTRNNRIRRRILPLVLASGVVGLCGENAHAVSITAVTSPAQDTMGNGIHYTADRENAYGEDFVFDYWLKFSGTSGSISRLWNDYTFLRANQSGESFYGTYVMTNYGYWNEVSPFGFSLKSGAEAGTDNWMHYVSNGQYVWAQFSMPNDWNGKAVCVSYAFSTEGDFSLSEAIASLAQGSMTYWNGGDGNWNQPHWTFGTPNQSVAAYIDNGASVQAHHIGTTDTGKVVLGSASNTSGHLSVEQVNHFNATEIYVGRGGVGSLDIRGEANVSSVISVGDWAGASGEVKVNGNAAKLTATTLNVGDAGIGKLRVENGASLVTTSGYVGNGFGSDGEATITGSGSHWDTRDIIVGKEGKGKLTVSNGGKLTSAGWGDTIFGYSEGSEGTLIVDGSNSRAELGYLRAGYRGKGFISILNGAQVSTTGAEIGAYATASGSRIEISGEGSALLAPSKFIRVGGEGDGTLTVKEGGSLSALTISLGMGGGGKGTLNIGGPQFGENSDVGTIAVEIIQFSGGDDNHVNIFTNNDDLTIPSRFIGTKGEINIGTIVSTVKLTGDSQLFLGTTTLESGTLQVDGKLGGTLSVGETLAGKGTVNNVVMDGGTILPGSTHGDYRGGLADEAGLLTINGDLTMDPLTTLAISIFGTGAGEFSQIHVGGTIVASSFELELITSMSYLPQVGDTFRIFTGHTFTGNVRLTSHLPEGYYWNSSRLQSEGLVYITSHDGAIPEPSTWALLGVGVIVTVVAMRRRRVA